MDPQLFPPLAARWPPETCPRSVGMVRGGPWGPADPAGELAFARQPPLALSETAPGPRREFEPFRSSHTSQPWDSH
jgi:hypothetical protein